MVKSKGSKMSSGLTKTYRANRHSKLHKILEGKRRRLIARLNNFGQSGNMEESIQALRTRLHPFVKKRKVKLVDYRSQLLAILKSA
ncbi:MAG: hypothetical protein PHN69_05690 [Candidatus Pacebacteria bacterium]|nr:hypothetical protein [Candidatus Paceibacterota bacterium]